jgi:uncharacterized membrane protein YkvI
MECIRGEDMNRFRDSLIEGFRIAMAYIGTVVGAGFATGQEILQFFTHYGILSFWAILISVVLFIFVGRSIMIYSSNLRVKSFGKLAAHLFGAAAPFVNLYLGVTFILVCGAMFAGAGALFEEHWGIPYLLGAIITAFLTLLVTLKGVKGILAVNVVIVPYLIIFNLLIFVYVLSKDMKPPVMFQSYSSGEVFDLVRTGVIYASFNIVLSIGVLASLGSEIRDKKTLTWGSILGGGFLGILLAQGNYILLCHIPEIFYAEIPLMVIISQMGSFFITAYSVAIWAEIFTTAVGNLFSIHTALNGRYKTPSFLPALCVTVLGLGICLLGFSNIVAWFYPALGIIGLVLSILILFKTFVSF